MKFIKKHLQKISLLSLFLVVGVFILVWFRKPYILAAGESGLFFYNPLYLLHLASSTWASPALGNPTGLGIVGLPFYFIAGKISTVLPPFLIQALTFGILLTSPIIFLWCFQKSLPFFAKYITVLFYLCNIASLTLVWNRLQYPYIFFYAFLPIAFFIFERAIAKRNLLLLSLFAGISIFFTLAFASIPLGILFWFVIFVYVVYLTFIYWKKKETVLFSWTFFFSSIIVWVLINSWWILPFLHSLTHSSYVGTQSYSASSDTQTFLGISQNIGDLSYIFRLMHKDFFQTILSAWGTAYQQPWFVLLSFFIPFLAFSPLLFKKKPPILYFFISLSLITTFFMKGSSGPFGFISLFLFTHIRVLESFRNPFEKFGLILPFAYAPLIGYSLYAYYRLFAQKLSKVQLGVLVSISLVLLFGVLVYPLWNGWVFSSTVTPTDNYAIGYFVDPPVAYKQANTWLNQKKGSFRILALPISTEGITNKWQYGYNGVETSNMLFDRPAVSFTTSIQFLENITNQVHSLFFTTPQYMHTLLSLLGVQYVFIRSDIDYVDRRLISPSLFTSFLSRHAEDFSSLPYERTFGNLRFYKNATYTGLVSTASTVAAASSIAPFEDVLDILHVDSNDVILNTDIDSTRQDFIVKSARSLLTSSSGIDYANYPTIDLSNAQKQLPTLRLLPSSRFYPFLRLKETIQTSLTTNPIARFQLLMTLSNKRLAELLALTKSSNNTNIAIAEKTYEESLHAMENYLHESASEWIKRDNATLFIFRSAFLSQQILLTDQLAQIRSSDKAQLLTKAQQAISGFSLHNSVSPLFIPIISDTFSKSRHIYSFTTLDDSTYSIVLKKNHYLDYYQPFSATIPIQIDNQIIQVKYSEDNTWFYLTDIFLTRGYHEIQLPSPIQKNLISASFDQNDISISSDDKVKTVTIPFENFDPTGVYQISFDYDIQKGQQAKAIIRGGLDSKNKPVVFYTKTFVTDAYDHSYQSVNFEYVPNQNTINQQLVFVVAPYNNCDQLYQGSIINSYRCHADKTFSGQYNRPTTLLVRNVHIEREFTNPLYLKLENKIPSDKLEQPQVSSKQLSSAEYSVSIKNAQTPFFLVLSESFHPLWKAQFLGTTQQISEKRHLLANSYANAWYIDRKGSYTIMLTYTSEIWMQIGGIISISIAALVIVITCILYLRKKYA